MVEKDTVVFKDGKFDGTAASHKLRFALCPRPAKNEHAASRHLQPAQPCVLLDTGKHRDGRFFFTFCLADTLVLEILHATAVLDFFLGNSYIFMFAARLILCPLLAWAVCRWVRPLYLELQSTVRKGWYIFTAISLIFYVMLSLSISVPTMITQRLEQLPIFVLQLILLPTIYIHILGTLRHQQAMHKMTEQENILKLQVAGTAARMDEYSAANEKFRVERHDFRHKMQTIAGMVEKGQFAGLRALALEYMPGIYLPPVPTSCTPRIIRRTLRPCRCAPAQTCAGAAPTQPMASSAGAPPGNACGLG